MCDAFGLEVTVAVGGGGSPLCVSTQDSPEDMDGGLRGGGRGPAWEEVAPSAGCGAINAKE